MKINVDHVAKLANLVIPKEEKEKFEKQLEETLTYVEKLNSIDTKNIESTSQVTGLENITRPDEAKPSLSQEETLVNAKNKHNGFFKVPKVLEE